jgi:hypothetical protein
MQKSNRERDPVPEEFANIEEAARFWDDHDLTDYEDVWHEVNFKVNVSRTQGPTVELEPAIADEVAKRARAEKTSIDRLVNRVLRDFLGRAA